MYNFNTPKTLQECFERLKKGCETLRDECGYSNDYSQFNPPATEEKIQDMEKRLGFALPREYREFLLFSNGAKIMGNSATIYGLDWIGATDPMVPAGYLTIGEVIGDGERIALSEVDRKIYSFYGEEVSVWDFEREMVGLLKSCELDINDSRRENEKKARDFETIKRDAEEFDNFLERIRRSLEANKENK